MTEAFVVPTSVEVTESLLSWATTHPGWPDDWPGTEHLLDDFCDLAQATPDEMAAFLTRYGAPEIGEPFSDGSDNPLGAPVASRRAGTLGVTRLRRYARALAAARRIAADLSSRRVGELADWLELQEVLGWAWTVPKDEWDDWKLGRERFARWLTEVLHRSGASVVVEWVGRRGLAVDPSTSTLVGLMWIMLAREVAGERGYVCDSCGSRVQRARPPREGEAVYCDRPECKREQRRRNQAKWRASKRAQEAKG